MQYPICLTGTIKCMLNSLGSQRIIICICSCHCKRDTLIYSVNNKEIFLQSQEKKKQKLFTFERQRKSSIMRLSVHVNLAFFVRPPTAPCYLDTRKGKKGCVEHPRVQLYYCHQYQCKIHRSQEEVGFLMEMSYCLAHLLS